MSWCDENGFLGGRIDDWIRQHRKTHQQVFDLAHELNREGHAFLDGRSITTSDSHAQKGSHLAFQHFVFGVLDNTDNVKIQDAALFVRACGPPRAGAGSRLACRRLWSG